MATGGGYYRPAKDDDNLDSIINCVGLRLRNHNRQHRLTRRLQDVKVQLPPPDTRRRRIVRHSRRSCTDSSAVKTMPTDHRITYAKWSCVDSEKVSELLEVEEIVNVLQNETSKVSTEKQDKDKEFSPSTFLQYDDPIDWPTITDKIRTILVSNGPRRPEENLSYPVSTDGRNFSYKWFFKTLSNGVQLHKAWDNIKSRRRKELSEQKKARMATGGGYYRPAKDDDNLDSIINCVDIELKVAVDSDTLTLATVQPEAYLADKQHVLQPIQEGNFINLL
ncbi:hypothetical protein CBL_10019 [Carabus blaptoides fortunei]